MPLPKLLITAGLMAANMALSMSRKIEGPRLDDLKFTGGDYGAALPDVWGLRRMQVPIFWAEDLKEVKRRRKTKGGKYNEYTYYGTWAVALAGHEIEQVTRVWFDTHLVFDLTGAGPVTPFDFGESRTEKLARDLSAARGKAGNAYFAIYTGTETQEADERIQATVEAEHGEGSCPAYRGTAYIVFKDIPLEKLGNRIPQVSVEFIGKGAANAYPYETKQSIMGADYANITFSPDFSRVMWINYITQEFEIWDTAARSLMISGVLPVAVDLQQNIGLRSDARFYFLDNGFGTQKVLLFAPDGSTYTEVYTTSGFGEQQKRVLVCMDGEGREHWLTVPYSTNTTFLYDGAPLNMADLTGVSWAPNHWFTDEDGAIWAVGRDMGTGSTTAYFYCLSGSVDGPDFITVTGLPPHADSISSGVYGLAFDGNIILVWDCGGGNDTLFGRIDKATGAMVYYAQPDYLTSTTLISKIINFPPGFTSLYEPNPSAITEISLFDFTITRTLDTDLWKGITGPGIYDPINHAILVRDYYVTDKTISWLYLDRVSSDGVTLESIANDIAARVGVSDYDFTDLDQIVPGWSATQGQASAMLEPLLDAYDSDIRPHGFTVQGIKRTGVSGGTLLTERFVGSPRYSVRIRQAAELPRSLTISFADRDGDQQPNNTRADRPLEATGARGEKTLDLTTLCLDVDEARNLGDRYFRRMWNERKEISFGLTAQQIALEPADVRTLDLDGETFRARLIKLTIKADDTLDTEWKYDSPSLALLGGATGANFDGRKPEVIAIPLVSKGFVLDVPLLSDADSVTTPVVYLAAAPYGTGTWPGATFFQAIDGEYSEEIASVASSSQAVWGYATGALATANPNVWDRGNTVNVKLQVGTLTGTTEATIDASPKTNLALIGDELINFTTATLETDGSYTLSGLKRGRRGTEWAVGTHAARDVFLLLDTAETEALGLSEVGTNLSFKAITPGRNESSAFPIDLSPFSGASLKPYAPCHLEAEKSGSDWVLGWTRRTRVGGSWTSGTSIPLSEASEEYEVEIMDGATVKRTVTGLTSPTYTYASADQTTDFGAPLTSAPTFRVYQVSDAVGRGFVATA